jgi:hypothetical protein
MAMIRLASNLTEECNMKNIFRNFYGLLRMHLGVVSGIGTLLFMFLASPCEAALSADPSGGSSNTWDCVFNGSGETGISYLTFSSDFTFSGYEVVTATPGILNGGAGIDVGRGGDGTERNGSGGNTNSAGTTNTFVFGFAFIEGNWTYDVKGNIIGSFSREDLDEGVSFVGTVKYGKTPRLTLIASTVQGKNTYHGVLSQSAPAPTTLAITKQVPDLNGQWSGFKREGQRFQIEQFDLNSSGLPGLYTLSGSGPNYSTTGACLISSQRKIGFALLETPNSGTNTLLRATVGNFSDKPKVVTAKTTGVEDSTTQIQFDATFLKPVF